MGFYDEMAGVATDLLTEFNQGVVKLKRETPGVVDPEQPWMPVEPTVQIWPLNAVVKRIHQRYEDGILIVETGDMVTFAVPAVVPQLSDFLAIDGTDRAITNLTSIPPAGVVVAYKAWCAA
ncbi:hypothetical protein [Mesorhizobium japonicum]|uniref:hypothetical protein n=1 Tax=Mesorhizobium japonicum TaxID=2066070 RepID=UPI0002E5B6A0|nr:hypothetical protein [Mesorhizobium japonicum]